MNRTTSLTFAVVAAAGALLGLVLARSAGWPAAQAWEASGDKFRVIEVGTDKFYNYDNTTKDNLPPQGDEVDNALTMVFIDNATSVKVRNKLTSNGYPDSGGNMHERLNDEGSWAWDSDAGRKGSDTCDNYHIRIYADPADGDSYTPAWGYYVLASTHKDENECFPFNNQNFGWGEQSEDHFEDFFDQWYSTNVDYINLYNNEPYREECGTACFTEHFWDNNNLATRLFVP